jgi:hypothetical protein
MGLVPQHAMAPARAVRSINPRLHDWFRALANASADAFAARAIATYGFRRVGMARSRDAVGGAAKVRKMKSRQHVLRRRDFCLFGFHTRTDGARLAAKVLQARQYRCGKSAKRH